MIVNAEKVFDSIGEKKSAPNVSAATKKIVGQGAQILLPFNIGDAPVTFSRWRLAELIEELLNDPDRAGR